MFNYAFHCISLFWRYKWDSVCAMSWMWAVSHHSNKLRWKRAKSQSFDFILRRPKFTLFTFIIWNQRKTTLIARVYFEFQHICRISCEKFHFFPFAMSKVWKGQCNIFIFSWQNLPVNYVTFEMTTSVALYNLILPNHVRAWPNTEPCDRILTFKFRFFVSEEVNSKGTDHICAHHPFI